MSDVIQMKKLILKIEVADELKALPSRTHGTASCYNAGCRGPLCKEQRRRQSARSRGVDLPESLPGTLEEYLDQLLLVHQDERSEILTHQSRGA